MIKYYNLSPFVDSIILELANEQSKQRLLFENYNFINEQKYIDIDELDNKNLQKKLYNYNRSQQLKKTCPNFNQQKIKKFEEEYFKYRQQLLDKYLKNINYTYFNFDFIQEKLFYEE